MNERIKQVSAILEKAKRILVLSGAGLSTESGIPDFRSPNGLYSVDFHGMNPERILSHRFFNDHTDLFYQYMRERLNYKGIQPDASYQLLAALEKDSRILAILTQNIDSLHIFAGSEKVVELHGSLARFYCDGCDKVYDASHMMTETVSYSCTCGGTIRPDVVLYDESVPKMNEAWRLAQEADLLLVLGTSLVVYPVGHIPQLFLDKGCPVVIINRDPTPYARKPGVSEINGEIGASLKALFPAYFKN